MKKVVIALDPKSLLIAALAVVLYNHVSTDIEKTIAFALAFIFSADFVIVFMKGILFPPPEIRAINMQDENLPPHIKEKVDELGKAMKEHLRQQRIENGDKKCTDPHCEACHPELN